MQVRRVVSLVWVVALTWALLILPARAEVVTVVGTGDGMALLRHVGVAFSRDNPGLTVAVPDSIGSGGGIKAVGSGEQKIGRVAREISDKEKSYNLSYVPLARLPVVIFAHKGIEVSSLTARQVADIYAGKITNWNEVGGPDLRLRIVRREDGDSALSALQRDLPEFKAIEITSRSKTASSNAENMAAVGLTDGAVGFGPYSAALGEQFAVLKLDGKSALADGYPVHVILALIYKEDTMTPATRAFVSFVKTPAGVAAMREADALPFGSQ